MKNIIYTPIILFIVLHTLSAKADIVADGTTATTVTINSNSPTLVNIAPANSDSISHNKYDEFSVDANGVELDNSSVFARTIINEVTSTKRSILNGDIEILGSEANLIIANPNGITANGVEFKNVGGVVLGAGSISYETYDYGVAGTSNNAVLSATGDIIVEGDGVFGKIVSLQLLANKIKIDGAVNNSKDASLTPNLPDIKIIAGKNKFEFDSSSLPIDAANKWISKTTKNLSDNDAILVDVTPRGGLTAGRVSIEVTHKGAGVSFAGKGMANIGNFDIFSNGKVKISKGKITAKQHIKVKARAVEVSSTKASKVQTQLEALNGSVYIESTDGTIDVLGGLIYGANKDSFDTNIKGGVHLKSSNDINITSVDGDNLAIIFSSNEDAFLEAENNITNNTGRIISNKTTILEAGNKISNITNIERPENAGVKQSYSRYKERLWYTFWLARRKESGFTISYGVPLVDDQLGYIIGDNVVLTAKTIENIGGEINANDGDITTQSETFLTEAEIIGDAQISRNCGVFVCNSTGSSNIRLLGGTLNATKNINITASKSFLNHGGQITPYGDFNIDSPDVELIAKRVPTIVQRPGGLRHLFGQHAWLYEEDFGGNITVPLGNVNIETSSPIKVTAGSITWGKELNSNYKIEDIYRVPAENPVGKYKLGILWRFLP
ncbi:MAG: filamentous hemagglutinin N-terminal domain-containing protein [Rhizobiales bacterium]|nr:filamentous hemagglutinin N-terminal domain-containing protein [Hyphomicrobiales bacterium]